MLSNNNLDNNDSARIDNKTNNNNDEYEHNIVIVEGKGINKESEIIK